MRTILFKAKRIDNNEWDYGYIYQVNGKYYIINEAGFQVEVNPDTICEFSQLTDKNGKRIWEGDIVKVKHCLQHDSERTDVRNAYGYHSIEKHWGKNSYYYRNYVIEFNPKHANYRARNKCDMHDLKYNFILNHDVEVIGNIHDNKEML